MNGSEVTAKIAGIESTAKITSEASTKIKTKNNGVSLYSTPFWRTKNLSPCMVGVMRMCLRSHFNSGISSILGSSSCPFRNLKPVQTKKAIEDIQHPREFLNEPRTNKNKDGSENNRPLKPYSSSWRCSAGGIAKAAKIINQTKTLSIARDFSSR